MAGDPPLALLKELKRDIAAVLGTAAGSDTRRAMLYGATVWGAGAEEVK